MLQRLKPPPTFGDGVTNGQLHLCLVALRGLWLTCWALLCTRIGNWALIATLVAGTVHGLTGAPVPASAIYRAPERTIAFFKAPVPREAPAPRRGPLRAPQRVLRARGFVPVRRLFHAMRIAPVSETLQPNPEGWIDHRPSVTAQQIERAFRDFGSPLAAHWPRRDRYSYASYIWHEGVALGIDPAAFMGFFHHESDYGLAGWAAITHSPGNLRCYSSALPESYCLQSGGGYEDFRNWFDGIDATYVLLKQYVRSGLRHVDEVVPVWAPPSDGNDDSAYVRDVLQTMAALTGY